MTNIQKRKIVIVECLSSAVNYIKDIYDMGYEPILLEPYSDNFFARIYLRKYHENELDIMLESGVKRPTIIVAPKTYEKTLKLLKELDPILIIPGSDKGVKLATNLAHDLGLIGNDPKHLGKMTNKFICQEALKEAGIRYIDSALVSDYKEALAFFNKMKAKNKNVILKPVGGVSSFGVFLVKNEEDLKKALKYNHTVIGKMHDSGTGKMLIQEYIDGDDYTIDIVSAKGVHKVTTVYKTVKARIEGAARVHDKQFGIDTNSEIAKNIIDYTLKVMNTVGLEYGASNCDIMYDEEGPVLIEINSRICGCSRPSSFQEKSLGIHESKLSLISYLNPEEIIKDKRTVIYDENNKWLVKYIIIKKDINVKKLKVDEIAKDLYGYDHTFYHKKSGHMKATVDLSTNIAYVFFVGKDMKKLEESYDYLKNIEDNNPNLLYEEA